jgi:hypothetical protein
MTAATQSCDSPEMAVPPGLRILPITDVGVYRATLAACVAAEKSEHRSLARVLRAWIDNSPFGGCPMCDGRETWRNEPHCVACDGDGFVPESISSVFLVGQAAKLKGVALANSSISLLDPHGRRYQDFMSGFNSCGVEATVASQA